MTWNIKPQNPQKIKNLAFQAVKQQTYSPCSSHKNQLCHYVRSDPPKHSDNTPYSCKDTILKELGITVL